MNRRVILTIALAATLTLPATALARGGHATPPNALRLVSQTQRQHVTATVEMGFTISVPSSMPGCTKTVTRHWLGAADRKAHAKPITVTTFWCRS